MSIDVKVPAVGESVTEVVIGEWLKSDGDYVEMDEPIASIESDKATLDIAAPESGELKIKVEEGETVEIGALIAVIDPSAKSDAKPSKAESKPAKDSQESEPAVANKQDKNYPSPAAKKILDEKGLDASGVSGSGKDGRITKEDALNTNSSSAPLSQSSSSQATRSSGAREQERKKMSPLRKTIAKRLVEAKNTTAMLTTFNEVDMHNVMNLRKKYKEAFKEKHGVGLGFMSFFTKAVCHALKEFPAVNGIIDGQDIVYHHYADIGVAVSTPKGLMVPVVRDAQDLSLADIERGIINLATKARDGKLALDEMQGGTFTITNGGVFGSMLSTPILNIPQSAILGMHNIVQRPVAVDGQVVIRPIMYLALSYDHRIIDGRESVSFLKMVKELIEDPQRLLLDL